MQQPWVSVGTDYGAINPTGPLGESKAHPRAYGSFAQIGKYVRDDMAMQTLCASSLRCRRNARSLTIAACCAPTTSPISPSSIS